MMSVHNKKNYKNNKFMTTILEKLIFSLSCGFIPFHSPHQIFHFTSKICHMVKEFVFHVDNKYLTTMCLKVLPNSTPQLTLKHN